MKRIYILLLFIMVVSHASVSAQALVNNPCNLPSPAGAEWTIGAPCVNVSTAGFTNLFNPGTCNSGARDDGWGWFTGTGNPVTVNFNSAQDAVIHLFSVTAPCSVTQVGCADNNVSGIESISNIPTVAGTVYFIRIQLFNSNNTITGCLEVVSAAPAPSALTDNPCGLPAGAEWTLDDPCTATTTAPMTPLFDPASCGSGAFDDGWAWYTGTGAQNTITYTADAGIDVVIHLFEADVSSGCTVTQIACANDNGAGGAETIIGGGTLGQLYFVRVQRVGSNSTATGCLGIVNNPATCNDNIQNGTETGIDCGGSCPATCPPPPTSSTNACSNTTNTPVAMVTCSALGTPVFDGLTGLVSYNGTTESGAPSPVPNCGPAWGGSGNFTAWANYDLDPGITAASLASGGGALTSTADVFLAYYQGATCASLTLLGCEMFLDFTAPSTLVSRPVMATGLDPNLPLWVLAFSNDPFTLEEVRLNGFSGIVSNTVCASAVPASLNGCNVGSLGASFTPPTVVLGNSACSGGIWSSNENTVFYEFTPTSTNATLEVDDVNCNGDVGGLAQFGIWESCADVGTYGTEFLGCVVGDGTLTLSGMTIGQTYILVFDGNAGDLCRWTFTATGGILLQVELLSFGAVYNEGVVNLDWKVGQEEDIAYYVVEKSIDGINFAFMDRVAVLETDIRLAKSYSTIDPDPNTPVNYYRLKSVDENGVDVNYSPVVAVEIQKTNSFNAVVFPNPVTDNSWVTFDITENGQVEIEFYDVIGQKIGGFSQQVKVGKNQIEFETSHLARGVYYLSIGNNEQKSKLKFIKK